MPKHYVGKTGAAKRKAYQEHLAAMRRKKRRKKNKT
jgi:hypothetical protein